MPRIADTLSPTKTSLSQRKPKPFTENATLPCCRPNRSLPRCALSARRRPPADARNGYSARPVELDCHFESICEACTFFVTTGEFPPTLTRQRDDAADKGQVERKKLIDGLLQRLEDTRS